MVQCGSLTAVQYLWPELEQASRRLQACTGVTKVDGESDAEVVEAARILMSMRTHVLTKEETEAIDAMLYLSFKRDVMATDIPSIKISKARSQDRDSDTTISDLKSLPGSPEIDIRRKGTTRRPSMAKVHPPSASRPSIGRPPMPLRFSTSPQRWFPYLPGKVFAPKSRRSTKGGHKRHKVSIMGSEDHR